MCEFVLDCVEGEMNAQVCEVLREIKNIVCITGLDIGSDNSGSGKGTQEGLIYGKKYKFSIFEYENQYVPNDLDKSQIIWEYSYSTPNGEIRRLWEKLGEFFTLNVDEIDMCGQNISLKAYFPENCGVEVKFYCHNRFRHFDRKIIFDQIQNRMKKPFLIDQGYTSLCGMACIFYIFAKNDKNGYENFAKSIHRKGKATYKGYTIVVEKEIYNTNPNTTIDYPSGIPEIDWIVMVTTRRNESILGYSGLSGQDFSAINWPKIMKKLGKDLLGFKSVKMDYYKINKSYIRDTFGSDEKVRILEKDIDQDYKNGYEVCMLIDGDMVDKYLTNDKIEQYDSKDLLEYHWVVYEGGLKLLNKNGDIESDYDDVTSVEFNVFTWGELRKGKTKIKISKRAYLNNYYGYLRLK